jgi:hypothetical protein
VTLPGRGGRPLSDAQQITVEAVRELVKAKGNGATEVILPRTDVVTAAVSKGANRTTVYRNLSQLANRMGWQLLEPGSLKVRHP